MQRCPGTRSLPQSEHWEEPEYLNGGLRSATAPDLSGTCHPRILGAWGSRRGSGPGTGITWALQVAMETRGAIY